MLHACRVRVPCSTSNLGSGFDCVGLALDCFLTASWSPGGDSIRLVRMGTLDELEIGEDDDLLLLAFRRHLERRGVSAGGGVIRAHSGIPIGRGLGSSAAAVVAGVVLAEAALVGAAAVDRAALLGEAVEWEGHPDNVAPALLGGLIASVHDDAVTLPMRHPVSPELGFAYAAPGFGVSTKAARAALPSHVPHVVAVRSLGRVPALLRGLADADPALLAAGFADELHVPYRLHLIPAAAEAMRSAAEAGAYATTISGAGSGLIAVTPVASTGRVARAMADAFRRAGEAEGVVEMELHAVTEGTVVEEGA